MEAQQIENQILLGDALEVLRTLPDECVQMCVTSPPYWGLRDYGVGGQLGLEHTPEEYVLKLVTVFSEVRRALKKDGTLWLNLGDSYAGSSASGSVASSTLAVTPNALRPGCGPGKGVPAGFKAKDLIGIPWMVAFALRSSGWFLRRDIVWSKVNCMPESVTDRPTTAHEYIFLLSKAGRYYYDSGAILEPCESGPSDIKKMSESKERIGGKHKVLDYPLSKASQATNIGKKRSVGNSNGRNKRSVWTIPTQSFPDAHFATFPPKLIEPCILAGSRMGDLVLDPFMGAGTTGLVAGKLGRKWIGIELNPKYKAMAEKRIKQECSQLNMFHLTSKCSGRKTGAADAER